MSRLEDLRAFRRAMLELGSNSVFEQLLFEDAEVGEMTQVARYWALLSWEVDEEIRLLLKAEKNET